jgi:hypothetical protein
VNDYTAFREALANTPSRPLDDFPIPGLPTDPDECMLHLWALSDQTRRRNPEWAAERDALTAEFVNGLFGPVND